MDTIHAIHQLVSGLSQFSWGFSCCSSEAGQAVCFFCCITGSWNLALAHAKQRKQCVLFEGTPWFQRASKRKATHFGVPLKIDTPPPHNIDPMNLRSTELLGPQKGASQVNMLGSMSGQMQQTMVMQMVQQASVPCPQGWVDLLNSRGCLLLGVPDFGRWSGETNSNIVDHHMCFF